MKKIVSFFCLFLLFCNKPGLAQQVEKKINVVLLGTFHFGYTSDANKTSFPDLFSEKRQQELEVLTEKLAALQIDKVFIEREEKYQSEYDSLYQLFLSNQLTDTILLRPEEIQIGFRLAKKFYLKKVFCVDVQQELPYDRMNEFEIKFKDKKDSPFFSENEYPFTDPTEKLNLSKQTLSEYYIKLNNDYHQKADLYDYIHYAMSYTDNDDYTGPKFTALWYERNLKIFSKILNSLTAEDKTIFILFGSSHTDLMKTFFQSHPLFNLVELENLIKD